MNRRLRVLKRNTIVRRLRSHYMYIHVHANIIEDISKMKKKCPDI